MGGQMSWDLILDSNSGDVHVSDIHLSHINNKLPKLTDETLLNYSHQENVKVFYNSNKDVFYKKTINPKLRHNWIVIEDDSNKPGDMIYEDSFDAGAKNSNYHVYNKSIEVLCPVWLEKLSDNETLTFKITVSSRNDDSILGEKYVYFDNDTKFGRYFKNYVKYIGLDEGSDDVININLSNKKLSVSGLDVRTGNVVKLDKSYMLINILYRERPMMELDTILINMFSDNNIIAKQLFNFNFCFNLDDIMPGYLSDLMYGGEFIYKIDVYIKDEFGLHELPKRDFYSNYEYIKKTDISTKNVNDILPQENPIAKVDSNNDTEPYNMNVLSYLHDDRYVGYMLKNKFVQDVCHWSLRDNNEYIFNLYNGFGPYEQYKDDNGEIKYTFYSHSYNNTPDLLGQEYNKHTNNIGWCNGVHVDSYNDFLKLISEKDISVSESVKQYSSDFSLPWVNNIYYGEDVSNKMNSGFKVLLLFAEDSTYKRIKSYVINLHYFEITTDKVCSFKVNDFDNITYILVNKTHGLSEITFKNFFTSLSKSVLDPTTPMGEGLEYLLYRLKSVQGPPLVSLKKSLYISYSPNPSLDELSNEVDYYRDESSDINNNYILRYDGVIKPTFLTRDDSEKLNYIYFKTVKTQEEFEKSSFAKYIHTKQPPVYKSIGYCCVEKQQKKFLKYSKPILTLNPTIKIQAKQLQDEHGNMVSVEDYILNYLRNTYKTEDPKMVYNKYNILILPGDKSSEEYEFNIKLTLK
jgi:hypothetical protein